VSIDAATHGGSPAPTAVIVIDMLLTPWQANINKKLISVIFCVKAPKALLPVSPNIHFTNLFSPADIDTLRRLLADKTCITERKST